jgi:ankyrin repeat protein
VLVASFSHAIILTTTTILITTGNTLIFVAAQNGLKAAAKLCLRNHADLNRKNTRGNTPLHYCFK